MPGSAVASIGRTSCIKGVEVAGQEGHDPFWRHAPGVDGVVEREPVDERVQALGLEPRVEAQTGGPDGGEGFDRACAPGAKRVVDLFVSRAQRGVD